MRKAVLVFIILLAIWGLLPGLLTLQTSFASTYVFGLPKRVTLNSWRWVPWDAMAVWAKNSAIIVVPCTVVSVLISCMAGFGFAKFQFPGNRILFALFVLAMMIPGLILFVPRFVIVTRMGLYNSHIGMMLPVLLNPAGVFFARQYYLGMGDEILDAARVDGCNEWQVFRHIIVPMSKPLVTIVAIFAFSMVWGDLLWQYVMAKSADLYTMVVGLAMAIQADTSGVIALDHGAAAEGVQAAISVLVATPPMVMFIAFSKYFVEGLKIQVAET